MLDSPSLPPFSRCFLHTTLVWLPSLFTFAVAPVLTAQVLEKGMWQRFTGFRCMISVRSSDCLREEVFTSLIAVDATATLETGTFRVENESLCRGQNVCARSGSRTHAPPMSNRIRAKGDDCQVRALSAMRGMRRYLLVLFLLSHVAQAVGESEIVAGSCRVECAQQVRG